MSITLSLLLAASTPATPVAPSAFVAPVLNNDQLDEQRGGFWPRRGGGQAIVDANAVSTFQLQSETNRMTFDNWFANEGTVLIVNNLLAGARP